MEILDFNLSGFPGLLNQIKETMEKGHDFEFKIMEYKFLITTSSVTVNGRKYETDRPIDIFISSDGFTLVLIYKSKIMMIFWSGYLIYDSINVVFEYGSFNWGFSD